MTTARLRRVPPFELGLTLGDFLIPIRLGERAAIWQRNLLLIVGGALLITLFYICETFFGWDAVAFLAEDKLGFWEVRGYSNTADPWTEDRYA